jgi:hypothetical protein
MGRTSSKNGEKMNAYRLLRNAYSLLMGKPEGRRPLSRSRHRWVRNIKMDLG